MNISFESATKMLTAEGQKWFEYAVKGLPNFALALVVVALFVVIAHLARKLTHNGLGYYIRSLAVLSLLEKVVYVLVIAIGLFVALGILNLDKTVTSLLAGAGVLGLALGFAFQDITSNFVSGVLLAFKQPYHVGDTVEIEGFKGEVVSIDLRNTKLMTFEGVEIFLPNTLMFTKPLMNYTTVPRRRLDVKVGVSYSDDLDKVEKLVLEKLEDLEGRVNEKPIEFFYTDFGDSSINFVVRIWVHYPANQNFLRTQHQVIKRIKASFEDHDVTIPFPTTTFEMNGEFLTKVESRKAQMEV